MEFTSGASIINLKLCSICQLSTAEKLVNEISLISYENFRQDQRKTQS